MPGPLLAAVLASEEEYRHEPPPQPCVLPHHMEASEPPPPRLSLMDALARDGLLPPRDPPRSTSPIALARLGGSGSAPSAVTSLAIVPRDLIAPSDSF